MRDEAAQLRTTASSDAEVIKNEALAWAAQTRQDAEIDIQRLRLQCQNETSRLRELTSSVQVEAADEASKIRATAIYDAEVVKSEAMTWAAQARQDVEVEMERMRLQCQTETALLRGEQVPIMHTHT